MTDDERALPIPGYIVGAWHVPVAIRGVGDRWFAEPVPMLGPGETLHYWLEDDVLVWRKEAAERHQTMLPPPADDDLELE